MIGDVIADLLQLLYFLFRARSVPTEPSAGTDTARIVVVFYTSNHHQEAFWPKISLNERALKVWKGKVVIMTDWVLSLRYSLCHQTRCISDLQIRCISYRQLQLPFIGAHAIDVSAIFSIETCTCRLQIKEEVQSSNFKKKKSSRIRKTLTSASDEHIFHSTWHCFNI